MYLYHSGVTYNTNMKLLTGTDDRASVFFRPNLAGWIFICLLNFLDTFNFNSVY